MPRRVFVAGSRGLLGAALVRALRQRPDTVVLTAAREELDLRDKRAVGAWLRAHRPDVVILAAAVVGGIGANRARPVEFLVDNLAIQDAVMTGAAAAGVDSTVFLGSSCMYPRDCAQPMTESLLMTGPVEPTNASYAMAKLAGLRLAQALQEQHGVRHVCPLPCNLYGPGDHFELDRAHVVSALVRRMGEARDAGAPQVTLWGTGNARRELLHVDDCAEAVLFLLDSPVGAEPVNVGTGVDVSIRELAGMVAEATGYRGEIVFDAVHPDGMPRKVLDVSRLTALGWSARRDLREGLAEVVADFRGLPAVAA